MKKSVLFTLLFAWLISGLSAQSAEEIVRRADERMDYESAYMEARMVNSDQFGSKTIEYKAWAKDQKFLMEFTSDAEYGQKILRTEDRIYHFFPEAETIFIRGKGDTIVGLISYEDVTDESEILDSYDAELLGEDTLGAQTCYKIELRVKKGKRVAYPIQTIWIEKENYIIRRIEMFTRSRKALKTMEIRRVENIGGTQIATDILLTDEVRREMKSEIYIEEIELDLDIPDRMFTRRELSR